MKKSKRQKLRTNFQVMPSPANARTSRGKWRKFWHSKVLKTEFKGVGWCNLQFLWLMLRFPLMLSKIQDAPAVWKQLISKKPNFPKKQLSWTGPLISLFHPQWKAVSPHLSSYMGPFLLKWFYHILSFLLNRNWAHRLRPIKVSQDMLLLGQQMGRLHVLRLCWLPKVGCKNLFSLQGWCTGSHSSTAHHSRNTGLLTGMQLGQHTHRLCNITQAKKIWDKIDLLRQEFLKCPLLIEEINHQATHWEQRCRRLSSCLFTHCQL